MSWLPVLCQVHWLSLPPRPPTIAPIKEACWWWWRVNYNWIVHWPLLHYSGTIEWRSHIFLHYRPLLVELAPLIVSQTLLAPDPLEIYNKRIRLGEFVNIDVDDSRDCYPLGRRIALTNKRFRVLIIPTNVLWLHRKFFKLGCLFYIFEFSRLETILPIKQTEIGRVRRVHRLQGHLINRWRL